jgi:hypothetical protein
LKGKARRRAVSGETDTGGVFSRGPAARGLLLAVLLAGGGGARAEEQINPPLGPYINLTEEHFAGVPTWTATNRLVLTPYFYWYDVYTGAHITNPDGSDALTDHPATMEDFSFRSEAWHAGQLRDMMAAGIDIVLPVYWGAPSERIPNQPISAQPWSYSGIPPLLAARRALVAEGLEPPRIGMFYDTSTLQYNHGNHGGEHIDLTTPYGRQWFYESVRDYFSLIPPEHWAMIDGHPVIFLYSATFAVQHDQSCIDYLRSEFARDFGGRTPYIVREISWNVNTENAYVWGGALGLKNAGVASLGPGYDHSAVPGREPLVVDRENGAFFERNWVNFLHRPSNLVFVETWNEFHEGTDIAASREYGRQYIELNRHFVEMFRKGIVPPRPPGPYSNFKRVQMDLAATNHTQGLVQVETPDGATEPAEIGGSPCRASKETIYAGRYIYFRVDDSFKWADRMLVDVVVEYFDHPTGSFTLEFDGSDTSAPFQGAYTPTRRYITLRGTKQWRTATFRLTDARFLNSQNGATDFRLAILADTFHVRHVEVIRRGLPAEAGAVLPGKQPAMNESWSDDWRVTDHPAAVTQTAGLLQLTGGAHPPQLLLSAPEINGGVQEILARVRVRRTATATAPVGGLVLADAETATPRARLDFLPGPTSALRLRLSPAGPETSVACAWQPNTWYWLRLRFAPDDLPGVADLWARVWPADGETLEPAGWPLHLDYFPAAPALTGRAGLRGGDAPGAVLASDFFLLTTPDAPEVTVLLPPFQAPWLELHSPRFYAARGFQLILEGGPNRAYVVEGASDWRHWSAGETVETDAQGRALWRDPSAAGPFRFYRAWERN